jgi:hypothetical protein
MAQVADGAYRAGMRSLFRIPRTGHQVLHLGIAWAVIAGIAAAFGVAVFRAASGG